LSEQARSLQILPTTAPLALGDYIKNVIAVIKNVIAGIT